MHTPVFTFLKKIPHLFAQKLPHPYVCAHLQFEKNYFFWTLIQKTVLFFYYVTASKYDFPLVPMKLLNATNMPRKQKDKIRKKQENIDRTSGTIVIEENTFLEVFRDMPMEARHFLLFLA